MAAMTLDLPAPERPNSAVSRASRAKGDVERERRRGEADVDLDHRGGPKRCIPAMPERAARMRQTGARRSDRRRSIEAGPLVASRRPHAGSAAQASSRSSP